MQSSAISCGRKQQDGASSELPPRAVALLPCDPRGGLTVAEPVDKDARPVTFSTMKRFARTLGKVMRERVTEPTKVRMDTLEARIKALEERSR